MAGSQQARTSHSSKVRAECSGVEPCGAIFCMRICTLGKKWCVNVKHAGAMLMGASNKMFWKKRSLYKILIAIDTIL
jgi:hypothetical protein